MERADLLEHLAFAAELGITGLRPTDGWRRSTQVVPPPVPAPGHDAVDTESGAQVVDVRTRGLKGAAALAQLRETIGDCTRCKLHGLGRRQVVFGSGNPEARLMFVGEAPGADEDLQGFPFLGRAGQLLTKIIESIGLTRDEVYIANVIKCRPPQNRNPEPDEVEICQAFLFGQVDIIAPRVIVALGTFAAQVLLATTDPISRLRGQTYAYRGTSLIPTFHPAYLLRNPAAKRDVWEDMKRVRALLS